MNHWIPRFALICNAILGERRVVNIFTFESEVIVLTDNVAGFSPHLSRYFKFVHSGLKSSTKHNCQ